MMEIPVDDLKKDTGMNALLAKLDDLFLKEEKGRTYEAYSSFDCIMRDSTVSIVDYIINFEKQYSWMHKYKMHSPMQY